MDLNENSVSVSEYKALMVDTIDNIFNTLQTLCAATSQLRVPGVDSTPDRFFFSDIEMCQPLIYSIDKRFVKPQTEAMSVALGKLAAIFVTLKPSYPAILPSFAGGQRFEFIYPPRPITISFRLNPGMWSYPPRLYLRTMGSPANIEFPAPRRHKRHRDFSDLDSSLINVMAPLFYIFWADSVEDIHVDIDDVQFDTGNGRVGSSDLAAIRSAMESVVFGIRDFLRSKQSMTTFVPESYREILERMVEQTIFAKKASDKAPLVDDVICFTNSIVADFVCKPERAHEPYASFIRPFDRVVSYKEPNAIAMLGRIYTIATEPEKYRGDLWKEVSSVIETLSELEVNELRAEYEASLLMLKSAATYYEFTSAIRNLSPVEMLLAAV